METAFASILGLLRLLLSAWHRFCAGVFQALRKTSVKIRSRFFVLVHILCLLIIYLFTLKYCLETPSPGEAVAVLAVTAVLMTLREKMGNREKALYMVLVFVLMFVEQNAVQRERRDRNAKEAQIMQQERASFKSLFDSERSGFESTLSEMKSVTSLAKENIETVTGGNDICYMRFYPYTRTGGMFPYFVHVGHHPLYDIDARIVDLEEFARNAAEKKGALSLQDFANQFTIHIGDMSGSSAFFQRRPKVFNLTGDRYDFRVFFNARNGYWFEDVQLRKINGEWKHAIRVLRQIGNKDNVVYAPKPDNGFPDKNVTWHK